MSRLLVSPQYNPYLNIAIENYLLSRPADGNVTMYLWQNSRTVVIGQNQNPYAECNVGLIEQEGGYVMRRKTGGGAVFHDLGNLNFSFIAPYDLYDQARQFAVLQRAVAAYGLETEVSGRNDVLCQGRKFSGNAFSKGTYQRLHHGTILIKTDVELLQRYLLVKPSKLQKHGVASVQSRVVNLSELVPPDPSRAEHPEGITSQNIQPHLIEAFGKEYGEPLEVLDFNTLAAKPEVQELYRQFASEEWKYGRWKHFSAQHTAQFEWGLVEMALEVDEAQGLVTQVQIATDSLDTDIAPLAQRLLTGASTRLSPAVPQDILPAEAQMLGDIFSLIYD